MIIFIVFLLILKNPIVFLIFIQLFSFLIINNISTHKSKLFTEKSFFIF